MTYSQIMVDIVVEALPDPDKDKGDPLYLSGNIDLLVDSTLIRVGPFPGALLLLPTLENVAASVARVRRGDTIVEVTVVGDSSPLWFIAKKAPGVDGIAVAYCGKETPIVSRLDLDSALENATRELLAAARERGVLGAQLPDHIVKLLARIEATWPALQDVASVRGHLGVIR